MSSKHSFNQTANVSRFAQIRYWILWAPLWISMYRMNSSMEIKTWLIARSVLQRLRKREPSLRATLQWHRRTSKAIKIETELAQCYQIFWHALVFRCICLWFAASFLYASVNYCFNLLTDCINRLISYFLLIDHIFGALMALCVINSINWPINYLKYAMVAINYPMSAINWPINCCWLTDFRGRVSRWGVAVPRPLPAPSPPPTPHTTGNLVVIDFKGQEWSMFGS